MLIVLKLQCTECGLTKDVPSSPTADRFQISAVLPRDQKATTLRALLEGARSKQSRAGYVCDHCKKPDVTMEDSYIKHTSKYLIVQARRAVYTLGKQGRLLLNKNGEAIPEKLKTKVNVPAEAFDVAALCGNGTTVEGAPGARYEVFGVVTHEGD